jgi:polyketide biosynthesis 3-hydroxy-3-methylglutaryl-CoA synthase-like enzyme PksG
MDTCRPTGDLETGDPDLSLLSYLDCLTESYANYCRQVSGVSVRETFQHLAFHTPFAGMVKGAHRKLLRTHTDLDRPAIEADYKQRVEPSLTYAVRVGNTYSASLYLALCSLIDGVALDHPARVGLFSYGSGCSSEFFSGVIGPSGKRRVAALDLTGQLDRRHILDVETYDKLLNLKKSAAFGTENMVFDPAAYGDVFAAAYRGRSLLTLRAIDNYHRLYAIPPQELT